MRSHSARRILGVAVLSLAIVAGVLRAAATAIQATKERPQRLLLHHLQLLV